MNKKNIINLSKIFIKENQSKIDLIKDKKINKKSMMLWIYIILFFASSYLSYEIVHYLVGIGKPQIFLNGYFLFLEIILIMQSIMVCTNIFYFSKDIENILPFPFKPIEILIAKFNTLIFMLYGSELIFALVPFAIYGIYANMGILYFINLILSLIIFPIFIVVIVSVIMMFLMKTIKLFKNKDLMQLIISFILIGSIMIFVGFSLKSIFNNQDLNNVESEISKIEQQEI